ncbi:MAG TPA: M28 family peptidase [Actinomycetota bacterium]|nr:M28 family peptidase [Actinomycetota bacterium]
MTRPFFLLLLALGAACSTLPEGQKATKPATGPPEIRQATIDEHARQFDEEEPDRPAGSQDELAASVYIVAHLTDAGYVSRLDAVPVEDLVRSTNVVALPPSGEEPAALVVVAYDTGEGSGTGGHSIATWLEVARALRAIEPEHDVQFVALGAEHATVGGGQLGSRRLAQQLEDQGKSPPVFVVQDVEPGDGPLGAGGAAGAGLADEAKELGLPAATGTTLAPGPGDVFEAAGFETTVVGGGAAAAGPALLAYLATL